MCSFSINHEHPFYLLMFWKASKNKHRRTRQQYKQFFIKSVLFQIYYYDIYKTSVKDFVQAFPVPSCCILYHKLTHVCQYLQQLLECQFMRKKAQIFLLCQGTCSRHSIEMQFCRALQRVAQEKFQTLYLTKQVTT